MLSDFFRLRRIDNYHERREERSAAKPQPKIGISPAKTQRREVRSQKKSKNLASWDLARGISESESLRLLQNLRELRKPPTIVVHEVFRRMRRAPACSRAKLTKRQPSRSPTFKSACLENSVAAILPPSPRIFLTINVPPDKATPISSASICVTSPGAAGSFPS